MYRYSSECTTLSETYPTDDIFSDMKFKFGSPQPTDFSNAHLSQFTLSSSQGPSDHEVSLSQPPCSLTQPLGDVDVYLVSSQHAEPASADYEIAEGDPASLSQHEQYTIEDDMDSDDMSQAQSNQESLEDVHTRLLASLSAATEAVLNALAHTKDIPKEHPEFENLLDMWRGVGLLAIGLRKDLHAILGVTHDPETDKY